MQAKLHSKFFHSPTGLHRKATHLIASAGAAARALSRALLFKLVLVHSIIAAMLALLEKILPLALGAAASPMLFAVTILILAGQHPHARTLVFLGGAASPLILLGLAVAMVVLPASARLGFRLALSPPFEIVSGLLLLLVALGLFILQKKKRRPSSDDFEPMTQTGVHAARFYGLGVTTMIVNPSALALYILVASDILQAEVGTAGKLAAFLLVIVVMLVTIEVPLALDLLAPVYVQRVLKPIGRAARAHSRLIGAIVIALIGAYLLLIGLKAF